MGLRHRLETQPERQIPAQLQTALQQAPDDCQPRCDQRRLAMHRHHRCSRSIVTGYGEVRRQIPVFRCGPCRRMTSGMTLLGEEVRYQRFSKKPWNGYQPGGARIELRPGREVGGLRQKYRLQVDTADAFGRVEVAGRPPGTGRPLDANPQGAYRIEGNSRCGGNGVGGFWALDRSD